MTRHARAVLTLALVVAIPTGHAAAAPCWYPPVAAPVVDPFREPACTWCAGNRGIEYGTRPGSPVRAVATGTVAYAGSIAGTVYVVLRHADGRRVTYGNLRPTRWSPGDVVVRNTTVGVTAGRFHLGLRDGNRYVDPAPFIGALRYQPRLIPTDSSRANPAPPPTLSCRVRPGGNRRWPG